MTANEHDAGSSPAARRVDIVPHTHWDREWYAPFQTFRARLVELLDELLPRLEADPAFAHFLLDGQMAVVDDYLAIRPEQRERLQRLAAAGRLAAGPWYTLPDEFLVSGETHIRNLQLGLAKADELGGAMRVGYLPDMFGHIAQMPQIFRLFGFEHAVVWRGVPSAIDRTGFWWEAPDGSEVRAEYLPTGYGNGAAMPADPTAFLARIEAWAEENAAVLAGAPVLWMNGSDHRTPQAHLPAAVAGANALGEGRWDLRVTPLADHLAAAPTDALPHWRGEMRSGARTNVLMGVTSNRVDVRIAAARAERALEQVAEPLAAAVLPAEQHPGRLFDEAWLAMCRNAAHDSVCACSDDEVVATVLHRYAQARQIGDAVQESVLRHLADRLAHIGPVAVNPSARRRSGTIVVRFPGTEAWPGTQVVAIQPHEQILSELPIGQAIAVVPEITGWTDDLDGVSVDGPDADGLVVVTLHGDGTSGPLPSNRSGVAERLAELAAFDGPSPTPPVRDVRLVLRRPPTFDALVRVDDVPGVGWTPATPSAVADLGPADPVSAHGLRLTNGLVTLEVDPVAGTFSLDGHAGLGELVDGGDCGDTYNWCPPATDHLVRVPDSVRVEVVESGPVRGRVRIERTYSWPARHDPTTGTRIGNVATEVATTLELEAGARFVRATIELENAADDHRLRFHLPLPRPASVSHAECAFTIVERGLDTEGGPTETAVPTFPSRRFVSAGGLTVAHEGINEYELIDLEPTPGRHPTARTLALTLLRANRWLSSGPMATRPLPAGPVIELQGSQCRGRHTMRLAISSTDGSDPYALVEDAFVPLLVTNGAGLGDLPARRGTLDVAGAIVSSYRRAADGRRELRIFNAGPESTIAVVTGRGERIDLLGSVVDRFDGRVSLRPHEIVTLRLES